MATTAHPAAGRPMTAEALHQLGPDLRAELVEGVLVLMPPAGGDHGSVAIRVILAIAPWVHERGLGEVFDSSTGFVLQRDPDVVRVPDVAFVAAARLPAYRRGFLEVAPDLAVEVLSPSDTFRETARKLDDYFRAGVRLVWLIDPAARSAAACRPDSGTALAWVGEDGALDGGDVLPGLAVPLARLFAGLGADAPPS